MARERYSPCTYTKSRCGVLVLGGGRCPEHTNLRRTGGKRSSTGAGYDQAWRRVRRAYLRAHPVCEGEWCADMPAPMRPPAEHVDHQHPAGPHGPHGHDWSWLRSLCHRCHSRRTARDQPGGWHEPLA